MDSKTAWFQVFHYRLKDIHYNDLDEHMDSAAARADKLLEAFEKRFPPHGLPDDILLEKYKFTEVVAHGYKYKAYMLGVRDLFVCERNSGDIYFEYFSHFSYYDTIEQATLGAIKYYLDNIKIK